MTEILLNYSGGVLLVSVSYFILDVWFFSILFNRLKKRKFNFGNILHNTVCYAFHTVLSIKY